MRETITIFICIIIFIVALQTGLVKTGLDYETIKNSNANLQTTNKRLSDELGKYKSGDTMVNAKDEQKETMMRTVKELEQTLSNYIENGEVEVLLKRTIPTIKIYEKTILDVKNKKISNSGKKVMLRIVSIFSKFPDHEIIVTGYTNTNKIDSNWGKVAHTHRELSVYQATIVANWLEKEGEVEATRISSAGYGYSRPAVRNSSATNRRKNQYIEISLRPADLENLEIAREVLKKDKAPVYEVKKEKPLKIVTPEKKPEKVIIEEDSEGEVIGEDALDNIDGFNFDAGYEMPGQEAVEE